MTIAGFLGNAFGIVKVAGGGLFSVLGGAKYWLIAMAVTSAVTFGLGYWKATSMAEDKLIASQTEMYNAGVAAQRKFDDGQAKLAAADFKTRLEAANKRKAKVITITKEITKLVPQIEACTVSAEAMKALNDAVSE